MSNELTVEALTWKQFIPWFKQRWNPGEHMALVAPTGSGKTVFVRDILAMRKYVAALDPKGGDSSLTRLLDVGFERTSWPPNREIRKQIEEGKPARLLIGSNVKAIDDLVKLRGEVQLVLRDAFNEGGWTVYIDELQIVADKRLMALGASVERNLIAARDRGVSMVMSFQRPANVPRSASEMSTWFLVMYTRDRDTVDRLAEMAGRPPAEIRGMVKGLPQYCALLFSRNPREPVIVTRADL